MSLPRISACRSSNTARRSVISGRVPAPSPAAIIARYNAGKLLLSRRIASDKRCPSTTPACTSVNIWRTCGCSLWRLIVRKASSKGDTCANEDNCRVNNVSCFVLSRACRLKGRLAKADARASAGVTATMYSFFDTSCSRAISSLAADMRPRLSRPSGSIA